MSCPAQIIVSNAGLTSSNGIYLSAGNTTKGIVTRTIYTKDGNPSSLPNIQVFWNQGPNIYFWVLNDTVPIYGPQPLYHTNSFSAGSLPECPESEGVTWSATNGPWGGSTYLPVPTVAEYIPTAIDIRNNKYATATESGAHRFRRVHALGYV